MRRWGALLLLLSMAGSLVFGAYNHFATGGADNLVSVHAGGWGTVFQVTAVLLFFVEALGCWAGIALL